MITLSFERTGNGIYIAHTDVLRSLNRSMRRAGIDMNFSKGYNKHMALKLTQPLPLGIASEDEYVSCDVACDLTSEEFLEKMKICFPPFLTPKKAFYTTNNPNLAAKVVASDYEIECEKAAEYKEEIERLKCGFTTVIEREGKKTEKDYAGYVYSVKVENGKIHCRFSFGSKNLRADVFCKYLNEKFGLVIPFSAIVRKKQLVQTENGLIPAAEYLEKLE